MIFIIPSLSNIPTPFFKMLSIQSLSVSDNLCIKEALLYNFSLSSESVLISFQFLSIASSRDFIIFLRLSISLFMFDRILFFFQDSIIPKSGHLKHPKGHVIRLGRFYHGLIDFFCSGFKAGLISFSFYGKVQNRMNSIVC